MRLIDADEFERRIKRYDTTDYADKALYNFAHNEMITMPTVCDLEQIREDMENISVCDEYQFPRSLQWMKQVFIGIINKYIK